jgi:DNA replication protein DnaC
MSPAPAPAPSVDAELKSLLRRVKLGRLLDTLPERLALARSEQLPHADFLSLLLSDEVERRDRSSAELRARAAKLDPSMRLEIFDSDSGASFDRELWHELCSLRLLDDARGALILGPVGVGKTHRATALGHIAVRRRHSVLFSRADKLLRRLEGRPGWTTPSRPRCASSPASSCSSSTTSPYRPWTRSRPPTSTSSSSNGTARPPP